MGKSRFPSQPGHLFHQSTPLLADIGLEDNHSRLQHADKKPRFLMNFLHRTEFLPVQKMANTIRRTPRSAYYRHPLKTFQWLVTRLFELLAIIPFPEILSPRLLKTFQ